MAKHDDFISVLNSLDLQAGEMLPDFAKTRINQALSIFRSQKNYPVFCFGEIPLEKFKDVSEIIHTAFEFDKAGFLILPFSHFIYSYYLQSVNGLTPYFIFVAPCFDNPDRDTKLLCVESSFHPGAEQSSVHFSDYSLIKDQKGGGYNFNRLCTEKPFDDRDEDTKNDAANVMRFLLYFTMLLNTKSVTQEEVIINEALQRARESRGKPRLSNYIIVSDPVAKRHVKSGTHASPIPHWRRGHIRHWNEKKIPIAPVIVNAIKREGLVEFKSYIVDRGSPDAA